MLASLLDGADADRVEGWREYVAALAAVSNRLSQEGDTK